MSDLSGIGPEGETPVNPYNLLEAVNETSDDAHMGWLIFLAIMTYLMIAVTGVTHKDLLLQTPVELPILQVKIPSDRVFPVRAGRPGVSSIWGSLRSSLYSPARSSSSTAHCGCSRHRIAATIPCGSNCTTSFSSRPSQVRTAASW